MRLRSFWPAVLWSLVIIILSFMPGKSFPSADWMDWFKLDKWIHASLYFILFILIQSNIRRSVSIQLVLIEISYCLLLGVFTELIQSFFLEDRSGDLADVIANSFGVFLAIIFLRIWSKKWPWKEVNE